MALLETANRNYTFAAQFRPEHIICVSTPKQMPLTYGVMRPRTPAANNRRIRRLAFLSGFAALRQDAGRAARVPASCSAAFAATHRMAHRVHRCAAIVGLTPHPALAACFSEADIHV